MIRARLKIWTGSVKLSRSLVGALRPDNLGMSGLRTREMAGLDSAQVALEYDGRVETFISTLDDTLACIQAASGALTKISGKME